MPTPPKTDLIEIDEASIEQQAKSFTSLLDDIENVDDRKKALWRSIYQNALSDRHNAFIMFKSLHAVCLDNATGELKSTEMAVHARSLSGYIAAMSKCVDQMIKLADLVAASQVKKDDNLLDSKSIYDQLQKAKA